MIAVRLAGLLSILAASAALPIPFEAEDSRWGYRDVSGKTVIPARYLVAQEFSKTGVAAVADEKGWAMIDRRGQLLLRPLVVDNGPDAWSGGLARFIADGKIGFFDERGRIVIPARYDFALPFSEGLAAVCTGCQTVAEGEHRRIEGGRWGFIDRKGRGRIPLEFELAESFEHGSARVRKDGVEQRIDPRGRVVPPPGP